MYTKIKQHIQNHKEAYVVGITVAGITYIIMRDPRLFRGGITHQGRVAERLLTNTQTIDDYSAVKQMPKMDCGEAHAKIQTITDSNFFGGIEGIGGNNYGDVIHNHSPQSLSYIVSQKGTDNWWRSQAAYARERGVSEHDVSMHFTRGRPLPNGETLIREGIAS